MDQTWDGRTLFEICDQCGLATPADYVLWPGVGAVVTEAGQRKLEALAAHGSTLLAALFDVSNEQVAVVLAGGSELPRRLHRRGEKLLRADRYEC
jgi:hypothetical protein